jgi:hypothetical protein
MSIWRKLRTFSKERISGLQQSLPRKSLPGRKDERKEREKKKKKSKVRREREAKREKKEAEQERRI